MLIDAHAHLDRYGELLDLAIKEITEHAIFTITNSMDLDSYDCNVQIGDRCPFVLPTFGIHPKNAARELSRLSNFSRAIEMSPIIGEIGLDFYWVDDATQYPAQRKVFEYFLAAAREQKKIVNLHTKGAEAGVVDLLQHYGVERAIVHWYSGPLDVLRTMIRAGFYFTVGVEVLFSEHIREIARQVPVNQLLTETDNPGGLKWFNGKPGMPHVIEKVTHQLAEIKDLEFASLANVVEKNFLRLIQDDPWLDNARRYLST